MTASLGAETGGTEWEGAEREGARAEGARDREGRRGEPGREEESSEGGTGRRLGIVGVPGTKEERGAGQPELVRAETRELLAGYRMAWRGSIYRTVWPCGVQLVIDVSMLRRVGGSQF
jgi:hypothetical protein